MIGDIVGRPGRQAVERLVPDLRKELRLDLVIANGENVAGGFGITPDTFRPLYGAGVDVVTTGNHVWRKKEIIPFLQEEIPLIRPSNFPPGTPGKGYITLGNVLVINLMGRVFMDPLDCPFREADRILEEVYRTNVPRVVLVDFCLL